MIDFFCFPVSADSHNELETKKRGNHTVTRPTCGGSGIALIVRTSNAEAHADMNINSLKL